MNNLVPRAFTECRAALRHSIDASARRVGLVIASTPALDAPLQTWLEALADPSTPPYGIRAAAESIMLMLWTPTGVAMLNTDGIPRLDPPAAFWSTATGQLVAQSVFNAGLTVSAGDAVEMVSAARGIKPATAWGIVNRAIASGTLPYVVLAADRRTKHVYRADVEALTRPAK